MRMSEVQSQEEETKQKLQENMTEYDLYRSESKLDRAQAAS